jgi:beta-galactosidase GanA
MQALGIKQVRIGEFAWSRIEPSPGDLRWDWLDRAIEVLAKHGLEVVMCTPTQPPQVAHRSPRRRAGSRCQRSRTRLRFAPPL